MAATAIGHGGIDVGLRDDGSDGSDIRLWDRRRTACHKQSTSNSGNRCHATPPYFAAPPPAARRRLSADAQDAGELRKICKIWTMKARAALI